MQIQEATSIKLLVLVTISGQTIDFMLFYIGANLTDPMFRGVYFGKSKHKDDYDQVLQRGWNVGLQKIIITGGSLEDGKKALALAQSDERLFCTVGCHPTRCQEEFERGDPEEYLSSLLNLIKENQGKVVAVGECGLDYARIQFCPKEIQLKYFEKQIDLAEKTQLPMFLHCRDAASDLVDILKRNRHRISGAVIHSFDGTKEEADSFIEMGFYIGLNGCSLKTAQNLEAVSSIPSDRLLIETDAPWCEIKPTHASFTHVKTQFPSRKKEKFEENCCVKGRCEPSGILQVLEVLSSVRKEDISQLAETIYQNSINLFNFYSK